MTFQQLKYIVAVDVHKHFVTAADKCFVTQATLSMMIKKLEEELGVMIFDRTKHPVTTTDIGNKIVKQAKNILQEMNRLEELIKEEQGELSGDLKIGIIPTLAPYILPLFLNSFLLRYPFVKLQISELTTDFIIQKLKNNDLDVGLMAIPINDPTLRETNLFYEEFVVYASGNEKLMKKKYIAPEDIDLNRLWLLEEGHCLRSQVMNLCELKIKEKAMHQLDFAAGSIETLKKIVESNHGITILPALAIHDMNASKIGNIRSFKSPAPVREIGLVTYRYFVKKKLIAAFRDEILNNIPLQMKSSKNKDIINL